MDNEEILIQDMKKKNSIFTALYKNLVLIIICVILGGLLGLGYGILTVKPVYTKSSTVMLVTRITNSTSSSNNLVLSQYYLGDVGMILKSSEFISGANAKYSEEGNEGKITAGGISLAYGEEGSLIFSISYSDASYELAESKLEAVIDHAQATLKDYIKADGVELKETDNVKLQHYRYNYTKPIIFGVLIGGVLVLAYVVLKYLLDNTVKDKEEVEKLTGVSVLVCIADQNTLKSKNKK